MCSRFIYPATCIPNDHGSSGIFCIPHQIQPQSDILPREASRYPAVIVDTVHVAGMAGAPAKIGITTSASTVVTLL